MTERSSSTRQAVARFATIGALGAVTLAAGAYLEAHAYRVAQVSLPLLSSGELRVLHISDLHALANHRRKFAFISGLAKLEPDLVINTGDNISSAAAIEPLLDALAPLLTIPGCFVLGSNDKFAPVMKNPFSYLLGNSVPQDNPTPLPTEQLTDAFRSAGWADLNNRTASLTVQGVRIELRGTDDAHHGFDDYAAVSGPVSDDADLALGVTHAPYQNLLDAMHADGVQMIFAGHTHGGQVCLPVNRALVTNCDLPASMASGLSYWPSRDDGAALHVSAGLGTSPFAPFRLFCRPTATLVRLTAK